MKSFQLAVLLLLLAPATAFTQCTTCYSLESALVAPEKVQTLDLSAKSLTVIPAEISLFTHLKQLDLSNNFILAPDFDFSHNPFLRSINFANNPGIETFLLSASFYRLPIELLDFSNCSLYAVSDGLGQLSELKQLDLSHNHLSSIPMGLSSSPKLSRLNLSCNQLQPVPCMFCDFWQLSQLDIRNTGLILDDVLVNLQIKDSLDELLVSTSNGYVPSKLLAELPVRKLTISGSALVGFSGSPRLLTALEELTVENCELRQLAKLKKQIKEIPNLKKVRFISGSGEAFSPSEKTRVAQKGNKYTPLHEPRMLTVAGVTPYAESTGKPIDSGLHENDYALSQDMIRNDLKPIALTDAFVRNLPPDSPCNVVLPHCSFDIPAGAFLYADGRAYHGVCHLEIREYFDPFVMALEGAPMVMKTGDRAELFSSNGMFDFRASDSVGAELFPNPSAPVAVKINDQQADKQSTLYQYDPVQANWQTIATPTGPPNPQLNFAADSSLYQSGYDSLFYVLNPFQVSNARVVFYIKRKRNVPSLLHVRTMDPSDFLKRKLKRNQAVVTGNAIGGALDNYTWQIDTSIQEDLRLLYSRRQKRLFFSKTGFFIRRSRLNNLEMPQLVKNITLIPDYTTDVFRLNFELRGERKSFPIYFEKERNVAHTQKLYQRWFKQYGKAKQEEAKAIEQARAYYESHKKEFMSLQRIRITNQYPLNLLVAQQGLSLSFNMSGFGMVNCDYFYRNPPENFFASSEEGIDENGEMVSIPNELRHVIPSDRVYLSTSRGSIPDFFDQEVISFFEISSDEIAVVKSWEQQGSKMLPHVVRIQIVKRTAAEIRDEILRI